MTNHVRIRTPSGPPRRHSKPGPRRQPQYPGGLRLAKRTRRRKPSPFVSSSGAILKAPATRAELKVQNFLPLAIYWARRYSINLDPHEAMSVAQAALVRARDDWNPALSSFGWHAHFHIKNDLRSAYEQKQKYNARFVSDFLILPSGEESTVGDATPDSAPGPLDLLIEKDEAEYAKRILDQYLPQLTAREQVVVRRHVMAGEPLRTIARDLGICGERIRQISNQALARLRTAIESGAPVPTMKSSNPTGLRVPISAPRASTATQGPERPESPRTGEKRAFPGPEKRPDMALSARVLA